MAAMAAPVQLFGSLFLLAAAAIAWVWPSGRPPLPFSRAEVQFLFTAPVTRRQLVHYKLWQSQIAILIGSAIATLIMRPGSLSGGWTLMAGMWVVLMTLRLHLMGVALRRLSLASHGAQRRSRGSGCRWRSSRRRSACLVAATVDAWPALASLPDGATVLAEVQRLAGQGAAAVGAVAVPGAGPPAGGTLGRRLLVGTARRARHPRGELRLGAAVGRRVRGGVGRARRAAGSRRQGSRAPR